MPAPPYPTTMEPPPSWALPSPLPMHLSSLPLPIVPPVPFRMHAHVLATETPPRWPPTIPTAVPLAAASSARSPAATSSRAVASAARSPGRLATAAAVRAAWGSGGGAGSHPILSVRNPGPMAPFPASPSVSPLTAMVSPPPRLLRPALLRCRASCRRRCRPACPAILRRRDDLWLR